MIRKILLALAAVVALLAAVLVVVAVVILLPAHRQIREIEVVIPTAAEVDAALADSEHAGPVLLQYVNTASQEGPGLSLAHTVAVLTWPDGRRFLIDAGMDRAAAEEFGSTIELLMGAGKTQTFGPVEEQLGDAVDSVRGIGFTHLHIDHTHGITALCEAQAAPAASIFQAPAQAELHNLHTTEGHELVRTAACDRKLLVGETISPVPGFPGLGAIAAGGHTPGSTIFLARIGGATWIFSGDLTNSLADAMEDRDKGWVYSTLLVPENVDLLARWRLWLRGMNDDDTHVVVSHDLSSYHANGVKAWAADVQPADATE